MILHVSKLNSTRYRIRQETMGIFNILQLQKLRNAVKCRQFLPVVLNRKTKKPVLYCNHNFICTYTVHYVF